MGDGEDERRMMKRVLFVVTDCSFEKLGINVDASHNTTTTTLSFL